MSDFNLKSYGAIFGIGSALAQHGANVKARRNKAEEMNLALTSNPSYELRNPGWSYKPGMTAIDVKKAYKPVVSTNYAGAQKLHPEVSRRLAERFNLPSDTELSAADADRLLREQDITVRQEASAASISIKELRLAQRDEHKKLDLIKKFLDYTDEVQTELLKGPSGEIWRGFFDDLGWDVTTRGTEGLLSFVANMGRQISDAITGTEQPSFQKRSIKSQSGLFFDAQGNLRNAAGKLLASPEELNLLEPEEDKLAQPGVTSTPAIGGALTKDLQQPAGAPITGVPNTEVSAASGGLPKAGKKPIDYLKTINYIRGSL